MGSAARATFELEAARAKWVHVETLHPARLLPTTGTPGSVHVHQLDEIDWQLAAGLRWRWRRLRARRSSRQVLALPDVILTHSESVLAHVRSYATARAECLPIGIDTRMYVRVGSGGRRLRAGIIGSMFWHPSAMAARHAALRVWPKVRRSLPDAELFVAGWGADRCLADLRSLPGITVQSDLSCPSEFFGAVDVLLYLPGGGTGAKVKVLESLAYGLPVVTDRYGAEGLVQEGVPPVIVVANDDEAAQNVVRLLMNAGERERLARRGRDFLEEHHGPRVVAKYWAPVLQDVLAR